MELFCLRKPVTISRLAGSLVEAGNHRDHRRHRKNRRRACEMLLRKNHLGLSLT